MRSRAGLTAITASALVGVLLSLTSATPAAADLFDGEGNVSDAGANVRLIGMKGGTRLQGPGLPAWLRECQWKTWTLIEMENYYGRFTNAFFTIEELEAAGEDPLEEWYAVFCAPTDDSISVAPQVILTGVLSTWRAGDPLPQVINDWIVAYAMALIEIPVQGGTSSPTGDVAAPLIAQLDTWLWVDGTVWQTVSATTPPVFGVTATVTADPYRVEYETSEGSYIDCGANVGVPYDVSRPSSSQATDCSVVYHDASSVADQTLTSTVRWEVTWACSSSCGSGTLPDFVITNTRDVRVAELIGVGTSIGRDS